MGVYHLLNRKRYLTPGMNVPEPLIKNLLIFYKKWVMPMLTNIEWEQNILANQHKCFDNNGNIVLSN